jgi:flavin reductase (DIM6/NTAB) family NADH-FMN oxidoreductase RutF
MGSGRQAARAAVRRLTLGVRDIPQFAIVGLPVPQDRVEVILETRDQLLDVTSNHVAVSLDPFLIGIGLPASSLMEPHRVRTLVFRERGDERRELGRLTLQLQQSIDLAPDTLAIFRPTGGRDTCVGFTRRWLYYAWKRWTTRRLRRPEPSFADFRNLLTFYSCPRPVTLVTVMDGETSGNIFPMDLVGRVGAQLFIAALKNNSRPLEIVRSTRRMVFSRIPITLRDDAYLLAKQHRLVNVEWDGIPFQLTKSTAFGFPIPACALSSLEIEVRETRPMGSHTAILGVVVHQQPIDDSGVGMHHVSGLYEDHYKAHGRTLRRT